MSEFTRSGFPEGSDEDNEFWANFNSRPHDDCPWGGTLECNEEDSMYTRAEVEALDLPVPDSWK